MYLVEREPISRLLDDGLEELNYEHWLEVGRDHGEVPLAIDWSRLLTDERNGYYIGIALRRDGELIGYSGFFIAPHHHFRSTRCAVNDVVYVKPEHRGLGGGKLLRRSEELLRAEGVHRIVFEVPVCSGKKLSAPLERMGYAHVESTFAKLTGVRDGRRQQRTDAVSAGEPGGS